MLLLAARATLAEPGTALLSSARAEAGGSQQGEAWANQRPAPRVELPGRYFRLMEAELALFEKRLAHEGNTGGTAPETVAARSYPGALLAAAVLYAKQHRANPSFGDKRKLALALKIGDLLADENESGRFAKLLNHPWGTYLWLEAYRLLEKNLGIPRQARWRTNASRRHSGGPRERAAAARTDHYATVAHHPRPHHGPLQGRLSR